MSRQAITYTKDEVLKIKSILEEQHEKEIKDKDLQITNLLQEVEKFENKYHCAKAKSERQEFGRKYEKTDYDSLEFNKKKDVKVKHKSNGIIFELPIAEELNKPIDLVKLDVENDLEHYIKQMKSFYSQWASADKSKLSVVNLEMGEIITGYEITVDNKGKEKEAPIKQDTWIATFYYKTTEDTNPTENEDVPLVKRRRTVKEIQFDVKIEYNGFNEFEAWDRAESMTETFGEMYMSHIVFKKENFYLKAINYFEKQKIWIATYECSAYKQK